MQKNKLIQSQIKYKTLFRQIYKILPNYCQYKAIKTFQKYKILAMKTLKNANVLTQHHKAL